MKGLYALETIYFILGTFVGAFVACASIILVSLFSEDDSMHEDYKI